MNILVTGGKGQLGISIKNNIPKNTKNNFFFTSKKEINIDNFKKLDLFIKKNKIKLIINCAAYTNVDKSEINLNTANKVNNLALKKIALLCKNNNIFLVHISTDYVFNSNKKKYFNELAEVNPKNIYGTSKLDGEKQILRTKPKAIIIRTSWLYSEYSKNFVKSVYNKIRNGQDIVLVNNSYGSPTNANDLARFILKITNNSKNKVLFDTNKIFHFSNKGCISRYEFVKKIIIFSENKKNVKLIKKSFANSKNSIRPFCSCINSIRLKNIKGFKYSKWENSLLKCIKVLKKNEIK
jgi:dTDP-4-dehydrorhamnose reductase